MNKYIIHLEAKKQMPIKIIREKKEKQLPPKQQKTAVVVIGRFQPPTKGHAKIVDAAKKYWRKHKLDAIFLFIIEGKETSKDKLKNPLSGNERRRYIKNSTFSVGVKVEVAGSAFDAFAKCRELGYEPVAVAGGKFVSGDKGENRADAFKGILDKYFVDEKGAQIEHYAITVDRDEKSETIKGVSATLARTAAIADRYEDFSEIVSIDNEDIVKELFDRLQSVLIKAKEDKLKKEHEDAV